MASGLQGNQSYDTLEKAGTFGLRYGLVLIFLWIGALKFTAYEAEGIATFVMNSPFFSWAYNMLGQQGVSYAIGVIEISIGLLIATRPWSAQLSAIGSIGSIITYLFTLSFILTTPGVWQPGYGFPALAPMPGQFLAKDVVLLAASIWTAAEALKAVRKGRAERRHGERRISQAINRPAEIH